MCDASSNPRRGRRENPARIRAAGAELGAGAVRLRAQGTHPLTPFWGSLALCAFWGPRASARVTLGSLWRPRLLSPHGPGPSLTQPSPPWHCDKVNDSANLITRGTNKKGILNKFYKKIVKGPGLSLILQNESEFIRGRKSIQLLKTVGNRPETRQN